MSDSLVARAIDGFRQCFDREPRIVGLAPGRVELLGNHTDYNGGYVLPVAMDRYVAIVAAERDDGTARFHSVNMADTVEFDVSDAQHDPEHAWGDYVKGSVDQLVKAGVAVGGFDACICSNVPLAAGMSSSAALEVAVAMTVQGLFGFDMDRMDLAKLCRRAENEFVGVGCGILDQFSSLFGQVGSAMFLDCQTLDHDVVAMPEPAPAVVICDSMTSRSLADGMYNVRRAECETAVEYFNGVLGRPIRFLRDVTLAEFDEHESKLPPTSAARARHVLEENQRVLDGAAALREGRLDEFGRLMFASHSSSCNLFENSSEHLDALIDIASQSPGVIGAKLCGAGWAGCTVNVVRADEVEGFVEAVVEAYRQRKGLTADVYPGRPAQGAHWTAL